MNISVLGCGRWGSFIAWYLNHIGKEVTLWGLPDSSHYQRLRQERKNDLLDLPDSITLTSDLPSAVKDAEILIISISAQALRSFASQLVRCDLGQKPIVLCMKGIEETTGKRLSEIMEEFTHGINPIAVWVGPGHVQDFIRGIPNCMVIDSLNNHKISSFNALLFLRYDVVDFMRIDRNIYILSIFDVIQEVEKSFHIIAFRKSLAI